VIAIEQTNDWKSFYEKRINSSYQDYFEKRYQLFLEYIIKHQSNPFMSEKTLFELGCGIGSVSKYLLKHNFNCYGIDLSQNMVDLANRNVNAELFIQGDIFNTNYPCDVTGVSHGVLEHFSDKQIKLITSKFRGSIHYVPLDKYLVPSFGDERLLPLNHWLDLIEPRDYFTFNDDYDLCFKV